MNILSMENITKSYGDRLLFDNASFYLAEGEKVGIIGINGTGKSTLLKIMAGLEESDEGNVTMAGHVVCSFLPQHPVFEKEDKVIEAVLKKCRENGAGTESGKEMEVQAKTMLTQLGVTDFDAVCGTLSGGQRKRLALVGNHSRGSARRTERGWYQNLNRQTFPRKMVLSGRKCCRSTESASRRLRAGSGRSPRGGARGFPSPWKPGCSRPVQASCFHVTYVGLHSIGV